MRKICIFTGTRAEYGLLKPLMDEIRKDRSLKLQVLVSGMHLSSEFGQTYKEIEKDGFVIDAKVNMFLDADTPTGINKSIGFGVAGTSEALERLKPDILVILGDRFEAFAAATAALVLRIPIAHLYGGEATYGLIDEAMRHSMTKMSQLHFTATEQSYRRVIQLGESPERVFDAGMLGLDNIRLMKLLERRELEEQLKFKLGKYNLLVTFHPVTLEKNTAAQQFGNLLRVLDELKEAHVIFTYANADTEGRIINDMIDAYVRKNPKKAAGFKSLGQLRYLSVMRLVDAVVGNSSSGIIEAPSFKIATVNIGDRQAGRVRTQSIIDCGSRKEDIRKALRKAFSAEFRKRLKGVKNPYGDGHAAERIVRVLKKSDIKDVKKRFFDLPFQDKFKD